VIPTIRLISKKEVRTLMRGVLDERWYHKLYSRAFWNHSW
jgi:hypothetical protein